MESRKEFINRMAWMLSEIDDSKFMEYRANKRLYSGIEISLGKLIIHTQQEFEHIIKKLK